MRQPKSLSPIIAMASLRPIAGRCLAQPPRGILSLHISSRSANVSSLHFRAVVPLELSQRRYQSSLRKSEEPEKPKTEVKITFRQFLGRLLSVSLRNLRVAFTADGMRRAFRDEPIGMTVAVFALSVIVLLAVFTLPSFFAYFYGSEFSKYPEPIANSLRRAILYTNYKPDKELAHKYYKKALEQCNEHGLDYFSDEVMGIRIYVARWLEKIGNYKNSVEVLEVLLADCKKWMGVLEQADKDGKVDSKGMYHETVATDNAAGVRMGDNKLSIAPSAPAQSEPTAQADDDSSTLRETMWHKRQRILAKAISISVKLGELYSDEHVFEPEKSNAHLVWSVEESLREFQRRRTEPKRPGETTWLSPTEMGASMESLGRDYERKSQFQFAIPLFFQALRLCDSPCHRAVIMNNLAVVFAQHPIYSPVNLSRGDASPGPAVDNPLTQQQLLLDDPSMPTTREESLEAAVNWARNAYNHGKDVKGEDRTPECDEACAVALCNWGDAAAMLGKPEMARRKYKKAIEMSKKLGFEPGVVQAQEGIAKLAAVPAST